MTFRNLPLGKEVRIEAVLAVLGTRNLKPYLIEGGDKVVDYLLSTTDDNINDHVRAVGSEVVRIVDDSFIDSLQNQVFPLCGNCYSYINQVKLTGIVNEYNSTEGCELVVSDIASVELVDDEGKVINVKIE